MNEENEKLNEGVSPQDVENLQNAVDESQNPLKGLSFLQSLVMAIPVCGQMKHVQISLFHDDEANIRMFYDVVDVSKIRVPKTDSPEKR